MITLVFENELFYICFFNRKISKNFMNLFLESLEVSKITKKLLFAFWSAISDPPC